MTKLCEHNNCRNRAIFGHPGGSVQRCKHHKIEKMILRPKHACKNEEYSTKKESLCKGLVVTNEECPFKEKGNKKFRYFCTKCYQKNFPLAPETFQIQCKTKELAVRDFLNANFPSFVHEHPLWIKTSRIDYRCMMNNTMICIEITKNNNEKKYENLNGRWVIIRLNLDAFMINGVKKNPSISTRLHVLKDEIVKQMKCEIKVKDVEIVLLYCNEIS